ncbi:MAG: HEAT repeat domain-containing protein [Caldilineaceae bacterium]|nr:HEAT repeat domain-containing protein [Caldilineaceae bacterium]
MQNDYYTTYLPLRPEDDDETGFPQPRFTLPELLQHLVEQRENITGEDLFVLSDLSRQDAVLVRQEWPLVAVDQRQTLVKTLVDLALGSIDWHLGRFLRVALDDPDETVRRYALDGLWEETEADLLGPLIQLLLHDKSEAVRAAAAAAMGAYVLAGELDELDAALAMRAEEALLAVLQNPEEPVAVQARALESIAYSGETGVRQLIEDSYYSSEEPLRISALIAMGRSADTRWRGLARAELQNPDPQMRIEAARACGELESRKAEPDLLELLLDEDPQVRLAAIFALGRLGGRQAREALRALTESDDPVEAEAADTALEEMLFFASEESEDLLDDKGADEGDDLDFAPWDAGEDFDDDELGSYEK